MMGPMLGPLRALVDELNDVQMLKNRPGPT